MHLSVISTNEMKTHASEFEFFVLHRSQSQDIPWSGGDQIIHGEKVCKWCLWFTVKIGEHLRFPLLFVTFLSVSLWEDLSESTLSKCYGYWFCTAVLWGWQPVEMEYSAVSLKFSWGKWRLGGCITVCQRYVRLDYHICVFACQVFQSLHAQVSTI